MPQLAYIVFLTMRGRALADAFLDGFESRKLSPSRPKPCGVIGNTPEFGSGVLGSNPSEAVMNKVTILKSEDWEVLYVNGVDEQQRHSIEIRDLIPWLPIESIETQWIDETPLLDCLIDGGRFPYKLEDALKIMQGN